MAIEECKPKPSVKQTQNIHEGKEEENRPPARPNPRRPTDDIRRTAPPYGGIERARHRNPALGHRHAIHRCRDGGKPRCKRLSLYRIGIHHHMAFLGTLCCGIHRLLRTSSPSNRSRRLGLCTFHIAPFRTFDICIQRTAGRNRSVRQRSLASMVGRRQRHS